MNPRTVAWLTFIGVVCLNTALFFWAARKKQARAARAATTTTSASAGVFLHKDEGKRYVGDQLQFFNVTPDGEIGSTNVAWISLYYTEGKPFRLRGEVWLSATKGEPAADLPDGFALFLREWDGLRRYQINTRSADVKRRLLAGRREPGIVRAGSFDAPELGTWLTFSANVSATNLFFSIGGTSQQGVEIPGPLDIDGANKIAIAPGTRLRNLHLEVNPR